MLLQWVRISLGVYVLIAGLVYSLALMFYRRCRKVHASNSESHGATEDQSVPPQSLAKFSRMVLKRPRVIAGSGVILLVGVLAYPLSTARLSLSLDTSSLRAVTGAYTNLMDVYNWLQAGNGDLLQARMRQLSADASLTVYYSAPNGHRENELKGNMLEKERLHRVGVIEASYPKAIPGWDEALLAHDLELSCLQTGHKPDCPAIRSRFRFGDIAHSHAFVQSTLRHLNGLSNGVVDVSYAGEPFGKAAVNAALHHDLSLFAVSCVLIFIIITLV